MYSIRKNIGENCITKTQGNDLFYILKFYIKNKIKIKVSFSDVSIASQDFLQRSFGKSVKRYGLNKLNKYITVVNIDHITVKQLREIIAQAHKENRKNER